MNATTNLSVDTVAEATLLDNFLSTKELQREFMQNNLNRLRNLSEKIAGPEELNVSKQSEEPYYYPGKFGLLQKDLDTTHSLNCKIQEVVEKLEKYL